MHSVSNLLQQLLLAVIAPPVHCKTNPGQKATRQEATGTKSDWTRGHLDIIIIIYSTGQEKVIDN